MSTIDPSEEETIVWQPFDVGSMPALTAKTVESAELFGLQPNTDKRVLVVIEDVTKPGFPGMLMLIFDFDPATKHVCAYELDVYYDEITSLLGHDEKKKLLAEAGHDKMKRMLTETNYRSGCLKKECEIIYSGNATVKPEQGHGHLKVGEHFHYHDRESINGIGDIMQIIVVE